MELLRQGELDAAIMALPLPDQGMMVQPLYDEPFMVAVPKDHPWSERDSVSAQELKSETMLFAPAMVIVSAIGLLKSALKWRAFPPQQ